MSDAAGATTRRTRRPGNRTFMGIGVLVALALAFFVSPLASSDPDGLAKVASDNSLDAGAKASLTAKSPTANYATKGVSNKNVSKGISGVIGVMLTLGLGWGLFASMKRLRTQAALASSPTDGEPQWSNAPPEGDS